VGKLDRSKLGHCVRIRPCLLLLNPVFHRGQVDHQIKASSQSGLRLHVRIATRQNAPLQRREKVECLAPGEIQSPRTCPFCIGGDTNPRQLKTKRTVQSDIQSCCPTQPSRRQPRGMCEEFILRGGRCNVEMEGPFPTRPAEGIRSREPVTGFDTLTGPQPLGSDPFFTRRTGVEMLPVFQADRSQKRPLSNCVDAGWHALHHPRCNRRSSIRP
jgi:hypothetical protein